MIHDKEVESAAAAEEETEKEKAEVKQEGEPEEVELEGGEETDGPGVEEEAGVIKDMRG